MAWSESAIRYLLSERERKLQAIEFLSTGVVSIGEMRNGVRADTTAEAIATHRKHIVELEEILTEAGVAIDV